MKLGDKLKENKRIIKEAAEREIARANEEAARIRNRKREKIINFVEGTISSLAGQILSGKIPKVRVEKFEKVGMIRCVIHDVDFDFKEEFVRLHNWVFENEMELTFNESWDDKGETYIDIGVEPWGENTFEKGA